jgi:putative ABC transport system permease protein
MVAGSVVGLPAALWMTRAGINDTLNDVSRGVAGAPRTKRLAHILMTAEIALALVIVTGAGLMARSVFNVYTANIGVNPTNVLTMSMYVPPESYPGHAEQISFYQRLAGRLQGVPGVQSVAIASVAPTDRAAHAPYAIGNALLTDRAEPPTVGRMIVGPGYFKTMQASIVSGRDFNDFDDAAAAPVAIVNQSFARQHSAVEPVLLGGRMQLLQDAKPLSVTIVGIASDVVQSDRTRQNAEALVYLPYRQRPQPNMFVFARTRVHPATLATAFATEVEAMDAKLPIPGLMPLADRFARAYRFERNMTTILMGFAVLGLLLAVVGLYAVVAHSVGMRNREIGIRRALGASSRQIRNLVLREAAVPLVAGLAIGVSTSMAFAPVMEPILVRVAGVDPAVLGTASLTLLAGAVAACLLPVRHALQIDPAITLRQD